MKVNIRNRAGTPSSLVLNRSYYTTLVSLVTVPNVLPITSVFLDIMSLEQVLEDISALSYRPHKSIIASNQSRWDCQETRTVSSFCRSFFNF